MWPFTRKPAPPAPAPSKPPLTADEQQQGMKIAADLVRKFIDIAAVDPVGAEVRDERELPASKSTMVNSFKLMLMVEKSKAMSDGLYATGLLLAHYWPGIGPKRLKMLPDDFETKSLDETLQSIYDDPNALGDLEKFNVAFAKVGPEQDRITSEFDAVLKKVSPRL